ncbi:putative sugar phosphate isomerase involved in capsule formation [Frankia canadensis]|uniref:Putative sugar phosphate isomerase involved in capsule formation n=1 Tax=Frankia canadensis TaxID=1836972 RepID=A0A2I2KSR7_9ACTN|nr:SIS domain-containing protein [Frankia canadensis]SNQ48721.1 putative sugar phosphate isomerase involved in capsule formation [Frankia canadensis]SOU56011.1 putative sugar phosphate isomerase involved in capsule formation [Frankia canadensis]
MYLDEAILDDLARLDAGRAAALLPHVASAGPQVRQSATLAQEAGVERLAADGRPRAILVVGVGGSALAAGILAAVASATGPVPIIGHHTHGLPGWVGVADVVLAVSASGTSAETRSAVEEANRRGARVAVVTPPDTPLAHLVALGGGVLVPLAGQRPARAALWSLAVPLLIAGRALGVVRAGDAAIEAAATRLEDVATRCRTSSESFVNPAKTLALELAGTLPVLWGTSQVTAVAASRAAAQLAATAKYPALVGSLPHPGHDQIALLDGPFGGGLKDASGGGRDALEDFFRDREEDEESVRLRLILLRDPTAERPEVARQAEAAVAVAAERGVGVTELRAEGQVALERLASLIGLFDFTAVYLALALGIDPGQTPAAHDLGR